MNDSHKSTDHQDTLVLLTRGFPAFHRHQRIRAYPRAMVPLAGDCDCNIPDPDMMVSRTSGSARKNHEGSG